jgi:hypothetical protein
MDIDKTIECELGWNKIIYACHAELMAIDPLYKPLQIKEKFGGLRYYFSTKLTDKILIKKMHEVASKYENLSFSICEKCGKKPAQKFQKRNGWIKTYCDKHKEENK